MDENYGARAPLTDAMHRDHRVRTAFLMGALAGASIAWLVILIVSLLGKSVFG